MALELGPVIGQIGGGGGGGLEEIPVSMSGSGNGTVYPLTTVDAGDGAVFLMLGTLNTASTGVYARPHLQIGSYTHESPHEQLTGPAKPGIGMIVTGTVEVSILSRSASGTTSFTGTVYVAHF